MIGDPVLLVVVGADLLRAPAPADLAAPLVGGLGSGPLLLEAQQPGAQHLQRLVAVLQLALLILHAHHQAGGLVGDPHRRVGGVDRLAARPRGAEHADLEVGLVDLHLHLVGGRQHRHRGRGGVDAALRLGLGHPLHPVRPALEAQPPPHVVAGQGERHMADAAEVGGLRAQHVHLPALPLGVGQVHVEELAGEQVRLLAALGAADLHDDVLAVVGVRRRQQLGQLLAEGRDAPVGLSHLGVQRLCLGRGGLLKQLDGHVAVARGGAQLRYPVGDLGQLLVATSGLAEGVAVTRQVAAGEPRLDLGALGG